ncbi:pentatricopeptide repeat-containing protein At1g02370, mitochondrial-like [Salvia hispanica]|uniref:pentatricopeptide repeat-containing protein At1g02370, mitochondrial-like n=1 Tax=Salvia hispanica TaxID=49212 RepID=UPI0020099B62|nr:pentatricopeptide repeat-containing protein At1g02370, mitochondrial-like [Salvia hispanica]
MVNLSRQLAAGAPTFVRRLSTEVKAAAAPLQEDRLYRRLSALGRNPGMVARTINDYIREGRTIRKVELERCINELRKYKRYRDALEIMEWMELRKFNFNHSNYAIRLDLTAKAKGIAAAEDYFNSLSPSNVVHCVYGSLLNCYCNEKMADKALDIFAKMVEQRMVLKSLPFNNLMSMYCRLGQYEKVLILGEEMKKGNVQPDTCTYNLLMNSHANLNDIEGAERVFEEMKLENEKQCNWTSYSNLANIYIKAGYQEKAKLALINVEKEMDSHDREAYHFLISLYAGVSDLDSVHRVWKTLKSTLAVTTNRSYLVVLQALGNLGDIEGMTKCYKEWEAVCSSYDLKLAVAVIRAYLRHDMGEEAEAVLEVAMRRSEGPFVYAWEQFMIFYLNKNQIRPALQHMETATSIAHENKWQPRSETIDKFLNYFKQERDVSLAEEFYHLMKRVNCVDGRLYESLIETYKASGETLLDMRARMEADGVELSSDIEQLLASP